MIKGAFIFAFGAASGLAVGTIVGTMMGFKVSDAINKIAIGISENDKLHIDGTTTVTSTGGFLSDEDA